MEKKLNLVSINLILLTLFLSLPFTSLSQQFFFNDSIPTKSGYIGTSNYFYNFLSESLDSITDIEIDSLGEIKELNVPLFKQVVKNKKQTQIIVKDSLRNTIYVNSYLKKKLNGKSVIIKYNDTIAYVCYKNGLKNGTQIEKYDNSTITTTYVDGKIQGAAIITLNDSKVILNYIHYIDNVKEGLYFSNYENGMHKITLYFKNDKVVDGTYYEFNSEGDLKYTYHYKDGKRIKSIRADF